MRLRGSGEVDGVRKTLKNVVGYPNPREKEGPGSRKDHRSGHYGVERTGEGRNFGESPDPR